MSYSPIVSERPSSPAIARAAGSSLGSVEEATVRLRSWAAISGIVLSGVPFLRIEGDTTLVCLPTVAPASPHPETGVTATMVEQGDVAVVGGVPFSDVRRVIADVAVDLGIDAATIIAEFQQGTDGFGTGNLMIPLGEGAHLPLAAAGG